MQSLDIVSEIIARRHFLGIPEVTVDYKPPGVDPPILREDHERFNALTVRHTNLFPHRGVDGDCELLISKLGLCLRSTLVS